MLPVNFYTMINNKKVYFVNIGMVNWHTYHLLLYIDSSTIVYFVDAKKFSNGKQIVDNTTIYVE